MPGHAGLWRQPDFVKLWAGQTLAALSSTVTTLALPLIAALTLHATPFEMGLLAVAASVPNLIVGLHAGILADRFRRLPIMVSTDLVRALLLVSIPFSAALDLLSMWQLYAVLFLSGVCTTFFEVAETSYVPSLVGKERLVSANSALVASGSVASAVGPGLAGLLIQLLTAPLAIVVDALSLVGSAVLVGSIRAREPAPEADCRARGVWRDIAEGLRTLYQDRMLRAITGSSMIYLCASSASLAVYVLYVTRDLGLGPGTLGVIFGLGGAGSVAGALMAARFARWLGTGPAMIVADLLGGASLLLIPAADGGRLDVGLLMTAQFGSQAMGATFVIIQTSLRQVRTPDRVLGRMNASYRFLTMGTIPVGALIGGVLGEAVGLRATLVAGGLGALLSVVWLVLSPARGLREIGQETDLDRSSDYRRGCLTQSDRQ